MLSYQHIAKYFGFSLSDQDFQHFLTAAFPDLTEYDVTESEYIISDSRGIELGFTNNNAVFDEDEGHLFDEGNPLFSHFNIYPQAASFVDQLPFSVDFSDNRSAVVRKAGKPTQTRQGYLDLLNKHFLVDNYKVNDTIITFDYDAQSQAINFIQIRDNNLVEHLKL